MTQFPGGVSTWLERRDKFDAGNVNPELAAIEESILGQTGASIIWPDLPTADPHVVGQLWNNAGVLNVSAG